MSMRYPGGLIAPNPVNQQFPSGVWTGPQSAPYQANNVWANDSSFKNTTLLLHGDGATTPFIKDASTNNFQLTIAGDTKPNNLTPFITNGYWSNYFNGSSTYLSFASNAAFAVTTTADYTVEGWINFATVANGGVFQTTSNPTSASGPLWFGYYSSNLTVAQHGSATYNVSYAWTPTAGVWYHVAATRTSGTVRLFINGTLVKTDATTQNGVAFTQSGAAIGLVTTPSYLTGYLSNVRFVNGTSLYTAAFTPSTTPLTAVTNTVVLTCQSNRFVDNSSNAFAITTSGSPSVSMQQPFTAPSGTSLYGSGYFDGTGDYLTSPYNINWSTLGSYTLEFWVYHTSMSAVNQAYASTGGTGYTNFYNYANGRIGLGIQGTNEIVSASGVITANQWYHVAYTYNGTTTTVYVNGVSVASGTTAVYSNNSASLQIANGLGGLPVYGYMSNFRIVNSVLYTTTFTPSTTPLTPVSGTSLLTLQTNGPATNNGFLDSSYNSLPIAKIGNTTQGTFSPYGSNWSAYIGASNYLYFANNAALSFGTGDFCVEAWVYKTTAANEAIIDSRATQTATPWAVYVDGSNFPYFYEGTLYTSTVAITLNAWNHVAVTRSSGTLKVFVNGVQGYSATVTTNLDRSGGNQVIAANVTGGANYWSGYLSNLRIVKGSAVYTSAFTPSTAPLTAISGTSLLTFQSNRFIDNSTNAFALTVVGSPSVQRFSPFAPTVQYNPATLSGSGGFDGSGDRLVVSSSSGLDLSTADFTIEMWVYCTNLANTQAIYTYQNGDAQNSNYGYWSYIKTTGVVRFETISGSSQIGFDSSVAITANSWNHIAVTRTGTSGVIYVNGVGTSGTFSSSANNPSGAVLNVGDNYGPSFGSSNPYTGYISNLRIVKGTRVYTSNFTPPTAPLTAIANTSLLMSYASAAIFDNTGTNDFENYGVSTISTAITKYGTSSMYFAGSNSALNTYASLQNLQFGTGDFTVECWVNKSANGTNAYDCAVGLGSTANATQGWYLEISTSRGIYFAINNTSLSYGTWVNDGVWHHIAVTRSNGTAYIFKDGVLLTSGSLSTAVPTSATAARIGNYYNGSTDYWFNGYIDDLRVTKGVARYVTNFTPPVARMPNQ